MEWVILLYHNVLTKDEVCFDSRTNMDRMCNVSVILAPFHLFLVLTRLDSSKIWEHSSRVGAMISTNGLATPRRAPPPAEGRVISSGFENRAEQVGIRKAAVLPEPV